MNIIKGNMEIWTIGHSIRSFDVFMAMLKSFQIEFVADIRSFPGSRRFPQFNKEAFEITLPQNNLRYIHIKNLSGRRKVNPNSKNTSDIPHSRDMQILWKQKFLKKGLKNWNR